MARSRLRPALLVMLVMAALGLSADVISLNDDAILNATDAPVAGSNATATVAPSTPAPVAAEVKEPEEKKPSTQEEAELESYKVKVREVIQQEGGDPTDAEVTNSAKELMQLDKAQKKTPRMREIEQELRAGPEETRVEVDPKHFESEAAERQKTEVAKEKEQRRQKAQKAEMDRARKNEEINVKNMLERYTQETLDPALDKQIQAAKKEFKQASTTEKKLQIPADGPDPYGVHDKSSWAAPEKGQKAGSKANGDSPTAEAEKGAENAEAANSGSDDASGSSQ